MDVLTTQEQVVAALRQEIAALADSPATSRYAFTQAYPLSDMGVVTSLLALRDELARIYNMQRPGSIGISFSADVFDGVRYVTIQASVSNPA